MKDLNRRTPSILLLAVCLASLFGAETALAQAIAIPDSDPRSRTDKKGQTVIIVQPLAEAEDYRWLVEKLQSLAYEFSEYFDEYDVLAAKRVRRSLVELIVEIDEGRFYTRVETFPRAIDAMTTRLEEYQPEFDGCCQGRLSKVAQSLLVELEILRDSYDDLVGERVDASGRSVEVQQYLDVLVAQQRSRQDAARRAQEAYELALKEVQRALKESGNEIDPELLNRLREETRLLKERIEEELRNQGLDELRLPLGVPEPPEPDEAGAPVPEVSRHDHPSPPTPPSVSIARTGRVETSRSGSSRASRTSSASVSVPNKTTPIYINCPTGLLIIEGGRANDVSVSLFVEIETDKSRPASEVLERTQLTVFNESSRVLVSTDFPDLSDTRVRVVSSTMNVTVPAGNPLFVEAAFGETEVRSITGSVKINARQSDMLLDQLIGGIEASSDRGEIVIRGAKGLINSQVDGGSLIASDCVAEFRIRSKHSNIELIGCEGPVALTSAGRILISNHIGSLKLHNQSGEMEIVTVRGDLEAVNSYQPLTAIDIQGTVYVANRNAKTVVRQITGEVTGETISGPLYVQGVSGPLRLISEKGTVHLDQLRTLVGPSLITCRNGEVFLRVGEQSNFVVSASMDRGEIVLSDIKGTSSKNGTLAVAEISLGTGGDKLQVTGESANLHISR